MDGSANATDPTWEQVAAEFMEAADTWLTPDLAADIRALAEAGARVAFALVADCSPPHVRDTCLRTWVACTAIMVEGTELLGGVMANSKGAEAILEMAARNREAFKAVTAGMPPPAPTAAMDIYDAFGSFVAALTTTEKLAEAHQLLGIMTRGLRQAVDEYSVTGPKRNGVGIGSIMWEKDRETWEQTGSYR